MDMLSTLLFSAKYINTRIASLSLSQFFVISAMLLGLQQYYANLDSAYLLSKLAATTEHLSADNPTLQTVPALSSTDVTPNPSNTSRVLAKITKTTINTSTNSTTAAKFPFATSMSGSRVELANFTHDATKAAKKTTAKPSKFQFTQMLKQPLFTAVDSSPFAIGFGVNARVAIWQENPDFALASKAHTFVIMLDPGHGGTDPGSIIMQFKGCSAAMPSNNRFF